MSFNQSRPNDSAQYRSKSGRSAGYNNHRANPGGHGKGGPPAPSPSLSSAAGSRSFKKPGNAQGGQPRVSFSSANHHAESANAPASTQPTMPGGASAQPQARGGSSNAPVASTVSKTAEMTPAQSKGAPTVPKAPASSPANTGPDAATPATLVKGPGDQSKGFPFQFGSITPSFVNGMQVPARTSSAPPNIDEQKRDQARNDPVKSVPPVPIPPARQQLPRKDMASSTNLSSADVQSNLKTRKETQVQSVGPGAQAQKPQVHQVHRTPMPNTYQQPQVSKYSAPNPHIQSQGLAPASIPMQMPIPISRPVANVPPQVQPQYYLSGIQPHQMPPQGTLHQGQGFTQVPHLGNFGMGIRQYPQQHTGQHSQQQGGQFGGPRKSFVKITHPETHQEVRLDKPSDALSDGGPAGKSHPIAPPQSQPMTSYPPAHQFGYYPNYPTGTMFFPGPGSLPVAGGQINPVPQVPIFNYPGSQGPQNTSFMNPQANNLVAASRTGVSKQGTPKHSFQERAQISRDGTSFTSSVTREVVKQGDVSTARNAAGISSVRSSSASIKIEPPKPRSFVESHVKESDVGPVSSSKPGITKDPTVSSSLIAECNSARASVSCENVEANTSSTEGRTHEVSTLAEHDAEAVKKESYSRSNSMTSCDEKRGKIDGVSQPPVEQQVPSMSSLPSHATAPGDVNEGLEAEADSISGSGTGVTSESAMESKTDPDSTSSSNRKISSLGKGPGLFTPETTDAAPSVKPAEPCPQQVDKLDRENAQAEDEGIVEVANGTKGSDDSGHNSELFLAKSSEESQEQETVPCMVQASVESSLEVSHEKSDPHEVLRNVDSEISGSLSADVSVRESVPCPVMPLPDSHSNDISSLSVSERGDGTDTDTSEIQEKTRTEDDIKKKSINTGASTHISSSIDKPLPELQRPKSATNKGKKKRRELLLKADAAGSTLDLYMAYKGQEEKKVTVVSSASEEISSPQTHSKTELAGSRSEESALSDEIEENKAEPDDWEDAADISTPKLESSADKHPVDHPEDDICTAKKYSRDFLLKFEKQFTFLPENFQVTSDIADVFTPGVNISRSGGRDHHPNPGRPSTGPRLDRRGSNVRDDDRWAKGQGAFASGHDPRLEVGLGGNSGFRPAQGANYGVLRTPRAQSPNQYPGGILPGLMQVPGSQGVMQRTGSDSDRWQRATNFQKGLMPSPQTPLQVMHKAEKKYEVGKVSDEEQAKQRQLKAILNKLTPQNFDKLFEQVIEVQIDNATTLNGLISQIFDKALMEPTFCEMYANLCSRLSQALPDFNEGNEKITFKRLLLNKCQEEFERGEREQEEANKADEEGEVKQTEEQREAKRIKARRRMLGNIRFIGELYKKRMLTEKIMHECMQKLLGQSLTETPDEEDLEALCKLMSTIGEMIDHPKAKTHMDAYFNRMTSLSNNMDLSSRVRFMLKDSIDLRRNNWQQRRKVEGPKKIDEVHRDAQQERHGQAGRLGRSPGLSNSGRRGQQMEFTPRGNPLSSPNAQMGSFRGLPSQTRGFGPQDARFEERPAYEPRTLSVPLSHRSVGDDAITLGPQGGLGRGMSGRGPSSVLGSAFPDGSSSALDGRRTTGGLNGFSSIDRTNSYGSREDSAMRSAGDRYTGPDFNVQGGIEVRSPRYSSDRPSSRGDRPSSRSDRPSSRDERPSSRGERPTSRGKATAVTHNALPEKVLPEEKLRDMSIAAILEYYGAKDEKEVVLCIKELNSPSFYSSMVSHWVTDSFERKDMERDLLAKLLINLSKPEGGMLNRIQIVEGFVSVLTTLEDAVNDAPKAPEFLGRLFGKVIVENVVTLGEIGRILQEGGEEKGQLLEGGLAADVLGCTLEAIQSDRGEVALDEIRRSSNLHLQDFRPPASMKSRMLEKFI